MSGWLSAWAVLNSLVIMLTLGLAHRRQAERYPPALLLRATLGYNLVLPALGLWLLASCTRWFDSHSLLAMSVCVAAGGGTSAGAFVKKIGAAPGLTATLIILLQGLSLVLLGALAVAPVVDIGLLPALCGYLLLLTVAPFGVGLALARRWPQTTRHCLPWLERLGGALVFLLVLALLARYAAAVLGGPTEPLWAAATLLCLLVLPALLLERQPELKRSMVLVSLVRNLTLVLAVVAVLPTAAQLLPTVLAFGLFMYLACGLLLLFWRAE